MYNVVKEYLAGKNVGTKQRGFTLIELLVVVLIIAILAAVALPQYQKAVEKSRMAGAVATLGTLRKAIDAALLEMPAEEITADKLNVDLDAWETDEWKYSVYRVSAMACRKNEESCKSGNVQVAQNISNIMSLGLLQARDCGCGTISNCLTQFTFKRYPTRDASGMGNYTLVSLPDGMLCSPSKNDTQAIALCNSFNSR